MGFRSSVSKTGHPGEGKHEGLVRRNDVLANGFIVPYFPRKSSKSNPHCNMYMQSSLVSNVVSVTWGRVLGDWAVLGGGEKSDAFHSIY